MPRKPPPGTFDCVTAAVRSSLADFLASAPPQIAATTPWRVAVALSGGRDSMALLDAATRVAPALGMALEAVHVHHGLSSNADAWVEFCREQCALRAVPLHVEHVLVVRAGGESIEAIARAQRVAALRRARVHAVLLAHHADDQAETLLLQLLRGAGPRGLAAMPAQHDGNDGPTFLRPFLDLAATGLEAYARRRSLAWIEDESNADTRFRRNALRHDVMPALRRAFPGVPGTLARAAAHQAEAARLLDDLAALDAATIVHHDAAYGLTLRRTALAALAGTRADRARNVLRWFLRRHGLRAPSQARLAALLAQCMAARPDARLRLAHDGRELGLHQDCIVVHARTPLPFRVTWHGEAALALPGGTLHAPRVLGQGIAADVVTAAGLELRPRAGGERLRLAPQQSRAVSSLLKARAVPLWQRAAWPLVWHDDVLIAVPGFGVDPRYAAGLATPGYDLHYEPAR